MNNLDYVIDTITTHAEHTESEDIKSYILDTLLPFLKEINVEE